MFYCTPCAKENTYPIADKKEKKVCEVCGVTALCSYGFFDKLPETNDSFFNTTNEEGEILKEYGLKANSQALKIAAYFKKEKKSLSPSEVWKNLFNVDETPLTSVRRAISVLTSKGFLEKTDEKSDGIYDRPEYKWKLS